MHPLTGAGSVAGLKAADGLGPGTSTYFECIHFYLIEFSAIFTFMLSSTYFSKKAHREKCSDTLTKIIQENPIF